MDIEKYLQPDNIDATRIALLSSFERYFKFMFLAINEAPVMYLPFHNVMCKKLEDIAKCKNTKRNLCLNIPVGAGKSLIVEYFISYCFARNINNAFVYTSYNSDLILKLSQETKEICQHPVWVSLFNQELKQDNKSKAQWGFTGAKNRTGLNAKAMGGSITGLDCFSYDTVVSTSKGLLKIGYIVENKINVKILSKDIETGKISYNEIDNYIKKEDSILGKLELSDGSKIECTPCHKFYTNNRGYVKASNLVSTDILPSNPFYYMNADIIFSSKVFPAVIFVANIINSIFSKNGFISRRINKGRDTMTFSNITPIFSTFNRCYMPFCYPKSISYLFSGHISNFSNFNSGFNIKFKNIIRVFSRTRACTVINRINTVLASCTIGNISNSIIKLITIKMPNVYSFSLDTNKSPSNSPVNENMFSYPMLTKGNVKVSSCTNLFPKNFTFIGLTSSLLKNNPIITSYLTVIRNAICAIIVRDRKPFNFTSTHKDTSYCLTVRGNHNMYIGHSKVLSSNCGNPNVEGFSGALIIDDPMDVVAGMRYVRTREECISFYGDKLATRRRTSSTPTILIMQRIHKEDLTGWLETNEPDDWDFVKIPALSKDGESFWDSRYSLEELESIKNVNPYKFQAQYQQNPINAGGEVIKQEWFNYYDELPIEPDRIFITGDTAQKTKEHNDFTVFCAWLVKDKKLYLIDMIRGKYEAPDLLRVTKGFFNKYRTFNNRHCQGVHIEDKASGTGLIQELERDGGIPVVAVQRGTDKLTRTEDAIPYIYQGDVYLPIAPEYGQNPVILSECGSFQRDDSHSHDDIVDNIVDGIKIGISNSNVSILDHI